MALTLMLNGHTRTFDSLVDGASLMDLLATLDLKTDRVAAERNGTIVARGEWAATLLAAGDRLEIVHFVGGGVQADGVVARERPPST